MILSGVKISGYDYIGKPTLNTIGTLIYLFDYRFGATVSGGRVVSWNDLSNNAMVLTSTLSSRRLYQYSDGFGDDTTTAANISAQSTWISPLNKLHNGSPYLTFEVLKIENVTSRLGFGRTSTSTVAGVVENTILETSGNYRVRIGNNVGTLIVDHTATAVPLSEFVLLMRYYYGSGTGSNNTKMYVKSTLTQFTSNPTFSTTDSNRFIVGKESNTGNFKIKCMGAYDLTGKSSAQVDAFVTLFLDTLTADSEYSSLVTP